MLDGEVSITPRELKPGRWQITIERAHERGTGRDRTRKNFRGTAAQANAECNRLRREFAAQPAGVEPSKQTVWEAVVTTLETRRANGLMSELTFDDKMGRALHHIKPHPIAQKLLVKLRPDDVEAFGRHLAGVAGASLNGSRPLAPATRKAIIGVLSLATGAAARKQTILADPCALAERIRGPKPGERAKAVAMPVIATLFDAIPPRQRPLYELSLRTGLRRGEVCGLTFADIDLDPESGVPMLHVRRNIQRRKKQTYVLPTKTTAGVRDFPLSPDMVDLLRPVLLEGRKRALAMGVKVADQPVFPGRKGGFMAPGSLTMGWRTIRMRADVEGVRLHDLRHTYVTMALRGTGNIALVSARAGHASKKVTLTIYNHVLEEDAVQAVDPFAGVDITGAPAPAVPFKRTGS